MIKYKHFLSLFVIFTCLPFVSYAEDTAANQSVCDIYEQAASGWHQTYDAYGRTITVDIPIQVPDVDTFPVVTVIPTQALDSIPVTDWHGYTQDDVCFFNEDGFFRWDTPTQAIKSAAAQQSSIEAPQGMIAKQLVVQFNQLDLDTAYAYSNISTVRDLNTMILTKWNEFFPNVTISLMPHWVEAYGEMRYYDRNTDAFYGDPWTDFQGVLMVHFDQVMNDIPILCYASTSFTQYAGTVNNEIRYVGAIAIAQGMEDIGLDAMYYSMQYSLVTEAQELVADVPLIDLDQVIATYEQLITEGKLRSVSSLRLGYVAWRNKDDPQSHTLTPTWVLEGELFSSSSADYGVHPTQESITPTEYGPILVNAQTGELINPWDSSSNRSYNVPEIIQWESCK